MTDARPSTWAAIQREPLSLDAALDAVRDPRAGAVIAFVGIVRDHDGGRTGVTRLDYSAHPEAVTVLRRVVAGVAELPGVCGVAAVHREGALFVGDRAVICVVSAEHRPAAFEGGRRLIEDLKAGVPIWKQQHFAEGDAAWVGL